MQEKYVTFGTCVGTERQRQHPELTFIVTSEPPRGLSCHPVSLKTLHDKIFCIRDCGEVKVEWRKERGKKCKRSEKREAEKTIMIFETIFRR